MSDWNTTIIDEFRSSEGKVGGHFEGATLLLLHTTGARTGAERVNPLMYLPSSDDAVAIFASKAGAPTNPDWYHNLLAYPLVIAEIGTDRLRMRTRVATGAERDRLLAEQMRIQPAFAEYESMTTRPIPVIVLEPVTEDEAAIDELIEELDRTQSDVTGFTRALRDDVTIVNIAGRRVRGLDTFRPAMEAALAGSLAQIRTSTRLVDIQFVGADVALAHCTKTVSEERTGPADDLPSAGILTYVLVRDENGWRVALAQTTPVAA